VPPASAEAYYQLGVAFLGSQDFDKAILAFRRSLEIDPKHVGAQLRYSQLVALTDDKDLLKDAKKRLQSLLTGKSDAEVLNTLAFTELKLGDPDSAVHILEQLLVEAPGQVSAALLLAQTRMSLKDMAGAEAALKKACTDAPQSADARRFLGEFYISEHRMPEADLQLKEALKIDPKDGPARLDLARLQLTVGNKDEADQSFKRLASLPAYESMYAIFLFDVGRRDEAVREFEQIARHSPSDRAARTRLVVAYRTMNRTEDAKRVLQDALKKNAKDTDALIQRGEIYLGEGKLGEAETDLNQAFKASPKSGEVHYLLAKLSQIRGNFLTYRQELFTALQFNPTLLPIRLELSRSLTENKDPRSALSLLNEAPEAQKTSLPLQIQRNWVLWALGDMAELRKGIDQALSQSRSSELLIQDGLWKLRSNNSLEARKSLEEALKIDPSDLRALQGLRQSYLVQKDPAGALQKVKEYAARQPASAPVQDFLGLLLVANGNRTEARTAFTAAKAANPQYVSSDLSLVQIDAAEGKVDDARRRLQEIIKSSGTNLTARRWLGNIEVMRGDHEAAIAHFQKVIADDPNDAQASNNLAFLLLEYRNQADMALKFAEKAVAIAPSTPDFCDTLGWVLYRKGVYNTAIQYLEQASAHPENVVWKYHLAMAYAKAGNRQRGRTVLEAALKVDSKVPEAKEAMQLLSSGK
jgi:Tfp pilus assembly protein PilF